MKCPVCHGRVTSDRTVPASDTTKVRRRHCRACGFEFGSTERIDAEDLKRAERIRENAKRNQGETHAVRHPALARA